MPTVAFCRTTANTAMLDSLIPLIFFQDDTYTESFISTIGVDFVIGFCVLAWAVLLTLLLWVENSDNRVGRQNSEASNCMLSLLLKAAFADKLILC